MKQLLIIRHAKSGWDMKILNDFDRVLDDRGNKDAPAMAQYLVDKKINIDLIVSSPAKRAFTTACYFAKAYGITNENILQVPMLYNAMPNIFYETIAKLDNSYQSVAIFSHNPGITEFINELTKTKIDDMPTCGIFALQIDTNNWADFKKAKKKYLFFEYPKGI
jgi:phosphohistidine phosphatase